VQHGFNGFVFPFGNIDAMADAMTKLIDDAEMRVQMGERSRELSRRFQTQSHGGVVDSLLARL
jgi:glycosyltransferase involved in cell wall biosynthesis